MNTWPALDRFWSSLDSQPPVTPDGYLVEGTSHFRRSRSVCSTAEILEQSTCRVLLGEAGVGKSTALSNIRSRLLANDTCLLVDFADVPDASTLRECTFEADEWSHWQSGGTLHLMFDSLDESSVSIDRGVTVLRDCFRKLNSVERLTLTLASRPVAWPDTLRVILREHWSDGYAEYYLCPLRRSDVEQVLVAERLQVNDFFAALDRTHAHHLAVRPQTLRLLVRVYKRHGRLPANRTDLYREAILSLCEEANPAYRETDRIGKLIPETRVAIARRVAVIGILTDRTGIWTGPEAECPDTSVCITDLYGEIETELTETFRVETASLTEVLRDTGLFKPLGANHVTWEHRSFAEFLAADLVRTVGLTDVVLDSLFLHPSRRGVIPQLAGTAGWIGADRPEWFKRLATVDPRVLLGLDPTAGTDDFRAWAVSTLLNAAATDRLNDHGVQDEEYRRFQCSSLETVLRPFIRNATVNVFARRMAFRIAAANGVTALLPDLLAVALSNAEQPHVRSFAAYAAADLCGDNPAQEFLELLRLPRDEDPNDQLLGTALDTCWPQLLTTSEVFEVLRPPHNPNMFGEYVAFLSQRLPNELSASDLVLALNWVVRTNVPDRYRLDPLTQVRNAIICKAYTNVDNDEVLACMAQLVWTATRDYAPLPGNDRLNKDRDLLIDERTRRRLARAILPLTFGTENAAKRLVFKKLIRPVDAEWLVDEVRIAPDVETLRLLSDIARELCYHWSCDTLGPFREFYYGGAAPPEFAARFRPLLEPVALASPQADEMRKAYSTYLSSEAQSQQYDREFDESLTKQRLLAQNQLDAAITAVQEKHSEAWGRLAFALLLDLANDVDLQINLDVTVTPGWDSLSIETRAILPEAAERFLTHSQPRNDYSRLAGLKGLYYLKMVAPDRFTQLSDEIWRTWVSAIMRYVWTDKGERGQLFAEAYRRVPNEALAAWRYCVLDSNYRPYAIDPNPLFRPPWDERTVLFVRQLLQDITLRPEILDILWNRLLAQKHDCDANIAADIVKDESRNSEARYTIASALMAHAPQSLCGAIDMISPLNPTFFREWLLRVATNRWDSRWSQFLQGLPTAELGRLYSRVHAAFPPPEDPAHDDDHHEGYAVTPRDELVTWRSGVIGELESRGTLEACDVIAKLAAAHPDSDQLSWRKVTAFARFFETSWQPPTPAEVSLLLREMDRRLIRCGADLVTVLIESLDRYQAELHGHTPSAFQLWNEWRVDDGEGKTVTKYRPKEENRFSDAIKLHLQRDLSSFRVAINREVEVRPAQLGAKGKGERTDIHVVALATGKSAPITVIIEVKGGWHKEVETAMETQLRDRYLADSHVTHGIYVVGWFACPQWDSSDGRQADHRNRLGDTIEGARTTFQNQAAQLSEPPVMLHALVIDASLK